MKQLYRWGRRALLLALAVLLAAPAVRAFAATAEASASDAPAGVTAEGYSYRAVKVAWQKPAGAARCRVYRYDAAANRYVAEGESAYDNYIVYGLTPGATYRFQVTALYTQNGQTVESAASAAVSAVPGGGVLNAVSQSAPVPMFTVVDDDTRDPYSVKLFHDVCEANGVRGCYAVVTSTFGTAGTDGCATMLDQFRAYEADGFDMLLHAQSHDSRFLLKNRTDGWNGHTAAETAALAAASIENGLADMTAAGLGSPAYWVAPMGVHDAAITAAARNAGVECLLSVANKSYVTKTPSKSGYNRMYIPRVELYGTDGAYDPVKKNGQTGRHNSDRIWNTAADVRAQIDAAAANGAWVIICTHVYESEWYLPRVTLKKTGAGYTAEAFGAGLTAVWTGPAAVPLTADAYTFIFDKRGGVTGWYFENGDAPLALADYGVSLTGMPVYRQTDPAATDPDRSAFFADRFAGIVSYAKEKGLTNVTFSEGYAAWSAIYDAQERADTCHRLTAAAGAAPTCTAPGEEAHYVCTVCGDRFADPEGHVLRADESLARPIDPLAHRDENEDRTCDLCGASLCEQLRAENVTLYAASVYYNGKLRTPSVTVKNQNGEKLTRGVDYDVRVPDGRTQPGLYRYEIVGKGAYAGTVTKEFAILSSDFGKNTGLRAQLQGDGVLLTWNTDPYATQYSVYRFEESAGDFKWIGQAKRGAYAVTDLFPGIAHRFCVRAVRVMDGTKIYGPFSEEVSATPAQGALPQNLKAAAEENAVRLTWTAVYGANLYSVYRMDSAQGEPYWIGETAGTSYSADDLAAGQKVWFRVRPVFTDDAGNRYAQFSAAVAATPKLPVPKQFTAAAGANQVTLNWTAVPEATQYSVYRYDAAKNDYVWIAQATANTYTVQNLPAGTAASFKICAIRVSGSQKLYGARTNAVQATPTPGLVRDFRATAGENRAVLTWKAVNGANLYSVYQLKDGTYKWIGESGSTSYAAENLPAGETAYFRVRAVCVTAGKTYYGALCNPDYATPKLGQPKNLTVRAGAAETVLTWTAVPGASLYSVYQYKTEKNEYVWVGQSRTASYRTAGAVAGQTVSYRVRAVILREGGNVYGALCPAATAQAG